MFRMCYGKTDATDFKREAEQGDVADVVACSDRHAPLWSE